MTVRKNNNTTTPNSETKPVSSTAPPKIFEKILGVNIVDGKLTFLVKWANIREPQLILAEQLNLLYPQKVAEYYQSRIRFI